MRRTSAERLGIRLLFLLEILQDLRRELDDQEREAVRERKARESASGTKKPRLDEISQGAAVDADDPSCKVIYFIL